MFAVMIPDTSFYGMACHFIVGYAMLLYDMVWYDMI